MAENSCIPKFSAHCMNSLGYTGGKSRKTNKKQKKLGLQYLKLKVLPLLYSPSAGNGLWLRHSYRSMRLYQ